MAYQGFLRFDSVEVINVARTMAYIAAGLAPPGVEFTAPVAHDGLGDALGEAYRTPVLDEAPWYDESRPETHGFAGVLPIGVTGLDGTTAAREVVENIDDGGVAQMVRRATRTIACSALLVGDSSAAVYAGLEWLTTVLLRQCSDPVYSALLEGFSVLPVGFAGVEDLDSPLVDTAVDPDAVGWRGFGGNWHPDTGLFAVPSPAAVAVLDGGTPSTGVAVEDVDGGSPGVDGDGVDGGDSSGDLDDVDGGPPGGEVFDGEADGGGVASGDDAGTADGGAVVPAASRPFAHLVPPVVLGCLSRVEVTWTLTPLAETNPVVQVGAVDQAGNELWREPAQVIDTATTLTWVWAMGQWEAWSPSVWSSDPGVVVAVSVAARPLLDPEVCLAPVRRTWPDLKTVAGPTLVGDYPDECDNKMLQVEWTWVAQNAYRYGDPVDLVVGLPSGVDDPPVSNAAGVGHDYLGAVSSGGTSCPAPPASAPTCAYDPALPGFVAPPAAPVISDGTALPVNYDRSLLTIDPGVLPANGAVALTWRFENDATAKHNVRVRIWSQTDPDFTTHTECEFVAEFWITYIDADATFTIDGAAGDVIALCGGAPVPAGGVMRGAYRGAFEHPVLACGGRYFITVDTGATEGDLAWSLSYSPREG